MIKAQLWRGGYLQTGRGDEVVITTIRDGRKDRIIFSADLLPELKRQFEAEDFDILTYKKKTLI